jgi:hypothetical protein
MSIDPKIWGSKAWFMMYAVAFTYPENPTLDDQTNAKLYFETTGAVLPCEKCRVNFKRHLLKHPMTSTELANRRSLVEWLVKMNNETNKVTGGPVITYESAVEKYSKEFNSKNKENEKDKVDLKLYLIPLAIIMICLFIYVNFIGKGEKY